MNKPTFAIFSALLADYIMVTIIVPIINDLFKIDYGEIDEFRVGFVYSMKGLSQLCTGLFVGKISDKLQLKSMTQLGLFSDLIASLTYIFGRKFPSYLAARLFHGIGSSLIASSCFSLLANHYKTDKERGEIMSKAGSGIACGVLSGPVVGGLLYSLGEKMGLGNYARLVPFACCSLADILSMGAIHFFINSPYRAKKKNNKNSLSEKDVKTTISTKTITKNLSNWEILRYIPIMALVYLSFAGNAQISYIEPILPNYWMKLTENKWDTFKSGVLFAFSPLSYTILLPVFGKYGYKIGRHNVILIGLLVVSSIVLIIIPSKSTIYFSAIFLLIMGCGSGAVDASLQPMLAQAYDNLLERNQLKKEKLSKSEVEMTISTDDNQSESTTSVEIDGSEVKLNILPKEDETTTTTTTKDITTALNNENDKSNEKKELKEKIIKEEEEESEGDAHNKYTRVFSLGNMAMNVGFIIAPMISSFLVALLDGEEPNVNRFKSPFFKCCLIFTAFGFISSLVAIIPGLKRYQKIKERNKNNLEKLKN